jgi:hypothetical protein
MPAKLLGFISNGCYAIALVLLVLAGYLWWEDDGPGAAIDEPERVLADLTPGQVTPITFQLCNPTRHPVKVCGLTEC